MVDTTDLEQILSILKDNRSFSSFLLTAVLMLLAFIVMICFFLAHRHSPFYRRRDIFFLAVDKVYHVIAQSPFWIINCFFWDSDRVFAQLGIDSVILLKSVKMLLLMSVVVSILSLCTVLPVHIISGSSNHTILVITSLTIVPMKSNLLWVHFSMVYAITVILCIILFFNWKGAVKYRQKHFLSDPLAVSSLLFSDLEKPPSEGTWEGYISENIKSISGQSEEMVVYTLRNVPMIRPSIKHHDKLVRGRTMIDSSDQTLPRLNINNSTNYYRLDDSSSDVIETLIATQYDKMQTEASIASKQNIHAAVVILSNIGLAQTFRVTSLSLSEHYVKVSVLPEHTALLWHNLELGKGIKTFNSGLIWLLTGLVIIFWAVPFTLVAAITKLIPIPQPTDDLSSRIIYLFLSFLTNTFIPLILIQSILYIEHLIFRKLSTYENHVSHASAQFSILRKMCVFNAVNVFFIYTISSSFLEFLSNLLKSPLKVSANLASAIPLQFNFYMIYLSFHTLIILPWILIKGSLFIWELPGKIKRYFRKPPSITPRDRFVNTRPLEPIYIYQYSYIILVFGIGLVFSLLSPLISISWVPYYFVAYVFFAYDEERTNVCRYLYRGGFWPIVSDAVLAYLIFMQIIMIGMFTIKEHILIALLILPCCVFTIVFSRILSRKFKNSFDYPTFETMNKIQKITIEAMYARCKPYFLESFIPPIDSTSTEERWKYILERELQLRENS